MKITFLGTGTSQGTPVIGCNCHTCQSKNPQDQRLRSSILIEINDKVYVIDTAPDFRTQILRAGVDRIDAVLLTHEHRDHVAGLDDIRPFNFMYNTDIPIYTTKQVELALKKTFSYIFEADYPGIPRIVIHRVEAGKTFQLEGCSVLPIQYWHGRLPVMGYRFGNFAYLTDFKTIDPDQLALLNNLDILVISSLHHQAHHAHMSLIEALDMIETINPRLAYLTHLSHKMGLAQELEQQLPKHVKVAYDGLVLYSNYNTPPLD